MIASTEPLAERFLARFSRPFSAVVAAGSGTVLGLARWLEPSPLGHATHLQLGLGQCAILANTGYPCPMCGMTTTFSLMAHLHPVDALLTQPFGVVLFALTALAFAIALAELVQPRGRWLAIARATARHDGRLAFAFTAMMAGGWLYKVHIMRGLW